MWKIVDKNILLWWRVYSHIKNLKLLLTDAQNCFVCTNAAFPALWGPVANLRNAHDTTARVFRTLLLVDTFLKIFDNLRQRGATSHFELTEVLEIFFGSLLLQQFSINFSRLLPTSFWTYFSGVIRLPDFTAFHSQLRQWIVKFFCKISGEYLYFAVVPPLNYAKKSLLNILKTLIWTS